MECGGGEREKGEERLEMHLSMVVEGGLSSAARGRGDQGRVVGKSGDWPMRNVRFDKFYVLDLSVLAVYQDRQD